MASGNVIHVAADAVTVIPATAVTVVSTPSTSTQPPPTASPPTASAPTASSSSFQQTIKSTNAKIDSALTGLQWRHRLTRQNWKHVIVPGRKILIYKAELAGQSHSSQLARVIDDERDSAGQPPMQWKGGDKFDCLQELLTPAERKKQEAAKKEREKKKAELEDEDDPFGAMLIDMDAEDEGAFGTAFDPTTEPDPFDRFGVGGDGQKSAQPPPCVVAKVVAFGKIVPDALEINVILEVEKGADGIDLSLARDCR